ncbi:hypothetical protein ES705_30599 [subsurface metagenome]
MLIILYIWSLVNVACFLDLDKRLEKAEKQKEEALKVISVLIEKRG